MGTNRRYADSIERRATERMLERISRDGPLQTLSRAELQLDALAVTTDPKPEKIRAWVRYGATAVLVDAYACMWTDTAIAIKFLIDGNEQRCWVWRGAVTTPVPPAGAQRDSPRS